MFGLPVVSLRLVDPRFYHLDTALCVLGPDAASVLPGRVRRGRQGRDPAHFAELVEAKDEDADVLGLNAVSDGLHVVLPAQAARTWPRSSASSASNPSPVNVSELRKARRRTRVLHAGTAGLREPS